MPNGDLKDVWELLNQINAKGCARRVDDMVRIERLEEWVKSVERKLDRILIAIIGTAITVVMTRIIF